MPLPLDLVEMGLSEDLRANVAAVEPCPPIADGPGQVVLTTVDHLNPNVLTLVLGNEHGRTETVHPTAFHKFYSSDRKRGSGRWNCDGTSIFLCALPECYRFVGGAIAWRASRL